MMPSTDPAVFVWATALFPAVLAPATLLALLWRRLRPSAELDRVLLRIRTWWVLCALAVPAVLAGAAGLAVLLAAVSSLALLEGSRLALPRAPLSLPQRASVCAAIPVQYALALHAPEPLFLAWVPAFTLAFSALSAGSAHDAFLARASFAAWSLITLVFALSCVPRLALAVWPDVPARGVLAAFFLLLLTELNDVLQYLWGKALGGPRVAPRVSPRKTWAGLLGGVATTTLLATLILPALGLGPAASALGGMTIGVCGFAGDLLFSAFKRDLGVGESGTLLPGHGGILDRIDSLTLTAPAFYLLLRVIV